MKLFYGQIFPEIKINEEEQQHILKVLRMKDGETISITDGMGNLATGILRIEGKKVSLKADELKENLPDFSPKLHIAIAPTKNIDRTEFFVEKAVEMGISEISFLLTEKSERKNLNFERFQKQAISASKQSLRAHFPKLNDLTKFSSFVSIQNPETTFVAHCDEKLERISINEIPELSEYTVLIGPEGDFSTHEIELLAQNGIRGISLGSQRLRTETAGIFVAAWNYGKMLKSGN